MKFDKLIDNSSIDFLKLTSVSLINYIYYH